MKTLLRKPDAVALGLSPHKEREHDKPPERVLAYHIACSLVSHKDGRTENSNVCARKRSSGKKGEKEE